MFDSFLREPLWGEGWMGRMDGWSPSLDIEEGDDEVTVRAELPGVNPEDLNISVTGNTLVLSGEKKETTEKKHNGFRQTERRFGSFRRAVTLPQGVDADQVSADYSQGVLTIRLAKSPEAAPKRIPVKAS
ncbi:MAG: Hsp20/alpha crystallin family protein [Pirellulales bacterium]